jgi:hypothetical protein
MQPNQAKELLPVSKEEWVHWKAGNCTQRLIHAIAYKRAGMMEDWSDGKCGTVEQEKVAQGHIQAYKDIIEYILRDFDVIQQGEEVNA